MYVFRLYDYAIDIDVRSSLRCLQDDLRSNASSNLFVLRFDARSSNTYSDAPRL